jgi:hypothetical protein
MRASVVGVPQFVTSAERFPGQAKTSTCHGGRGALAASPLRDVGKSVLAERSAIFGGSSVSARSPPEMLARRLLVGDEHAFNQRGVVAGFVRRCCSVRRRAPG